MFPAQHQTLDTLVGNQAQVEQTQCRVFEPSDRVGDTLVEIDGSGHSAG